MTSVDIVQGVAALRKLYDVWGALFEKLGRRNHAQSYAWVLRVVTCLEDDPEAIYFAIIRRAGVLCGIIPLRYAPRRRGPFLIKQWELLWHPHSTISTALLTPEASASEILDPLAAVLATTAGPGYDTLLLPVLAEDALAQVGATVLPGLRVMVSRDGVSNLFRTARQGEALAASSAHFRRNLARQRKKLDQLGKVEFRIAIGTDAARSAFDEFLRVEASGWKGADGKGSAIRLHPNITRFYSGLIDELRDNPQVWIATLLLDGRAIAANFCVRTDDTLAVLKIAYDEGLQQVAPGNVLMLRLIEACTEAPDISKLSLVTGPAWAERWAPMAIGIERITVFAPTFRGRLFYLAAQVKRGMRMRHAEKWLGITERGDQRTGRSLGPGIHPTE